VKDYAVLRQGLKNSVLRKGSCEKRKKYSFENGLVCENTEGGREKERERIASVYLRQSAHVFRKYPGSIVLNLLY